MRVRGAYPGTVQYLRLPPLRLRTTLVNPRIKRQSRSRAASSLGDGFCPAKIHEGDRAETFQLGPQLLDLLTFWPFDIFTSSHLHIFSSHHFRTATTSTWLPTQSPSTFATSMRITF